MASDLKQGAITGAANLHLLQLRNPCGADVGSHEASSKRCYQPRPDVD